MKSLQAAIIWWYLVVKHCPQTGDNLMHGLALNQLEVRHLLPR
jgi:hypothetical protein